MSHKHLEAGTERAATPPLFGIGLGAVIASGFAMSELFDRATASRNVQHTGVGELEAACGKGKAVILEGPRLSKSGIRVAKLKEVVPELYKPKGAVET